MLKWFVFHKLFYFWVLNLRSALYVYKSIVTVTGNKQKYIIDKKQIHPIPWNSNVGIKETENLGAGYCCNRNCGGRKSLPSGKALRPDGSTNDFCKAFHQTLLEHMTGIFNYPNLTGFQPWMLDFVIIDLGSEEKENVPQNLLFLTGHFINKV